MHPPIFIDVFMQPLRDNSVAQVAITAMLLLTLLDVLFGLLHALVSHTFSSQKMREGIGHKCHRYLDDLGKASTEEKDALKAEHDEYSAVCAANEITNNFVDMMVQRVMELPERDA